MSNVVTLHDEATHVVSPFPQDSELYFTAVERELHWKAHTDAAFHPCTTHKMLLRNDDGVPRALNVVGVGYQLVQNKSLFMAIEDQFMDAFTPDELVGVKVNDSMAYDGRTCVREYQFPNVRCEAPSVSDIAFRTIVKNGFGGSSIALFTGAIDFFCTNGMISGKYDCMYMRHTKGLKLTNITRRIRRSIDVFYTNVSMWHEWYGKRIDNDEARGFFADKYSDQLAKRLFRQYLIEAQVHGPNMWALYSALTYYATHDEGDFATRKTDTNHSPVTMLKREEQVQSVVSSDTWLRLVA